MKNLAIIALINLSIITSQTHAEKRTLEFTEPEKDPNPSKKRKSTPSWSGRPLKREPRGSQPSLHDSSIPPQRPAQLISSSSNIVPMQTAPLIEEAPEATAQLNCQAASENIVDAINNNDVEAFTPLIVELEEQDPKTIFTILTTVTSTGTLPLVMASKTGNGTFLTHLCTIMKNKLAPESIYLSLRSSGQDCSSPILEAICCGLAENITTLLTLITTLNEPQVFELLNQADTAGSTPLIKAIWSKDTEALKLLLEASATNLCPENQMILLENQNLYELTALMAAAQKGSEEAVDLLLKAASNHGQAFTRSFIRKINIYGEGAIDCAQQIEHHKIYERLHQALNQITI